MFFNTTKVIAYKILYPVRLFFTFFTCSTFFLPVYRQDCYCGNCSDSTLCNSGGFCTSCGSTLCKQNKGITGLCCPTDISGSANTIVKLYVSSKILNIKTTRTGPNDDGDSLCRAALPAKVPVELIPYTLADFASFRSEPPTKKMGGSMNLLSVVRTLTMSVVQNDRESSDFYPALTFQSLCGE